MPRTYKSEALAAVHEMIEGLHEAGAVDKQTLREFDEACLAPADTSQSLFDAVKIVRTVDQTEPLADDWSISTLEN